MAKKSVEHKPFENCTRAYIYNDSMLREYCFDVYYAWLAFSLVTFSSNIEFRVSATRNHLCRRQHIIFLTPDEPYKHFFSFNVSLSLFLFR